MDTIQHQVAKKLLPKIISATRSHKLLTYGSAAKSVGRDPKNNSRMIAQVCDLLDAAAALAGTPLLALVAVREKSLKINRRAWADTPHRENIIHRSQSHEFDDKDFMAISAALKKLEGKSNKAAWQFVYGTISRKELIRRLSAITLAENYDAIDDIGSDRPLRVATSGYQYARNSKVRAGVIRRAAGKCEFCGKLGFICSDGSRYLECHHIVALANDGEDRMSNVIALCPEDHREAHFGKRRGRLEKEMILKLKIIMEKLEIR